MKQNDASLTAPWTTIEVANICRWQQCPALHPLTCEKNSSHGPLEVQSDGLRCSKCNYTQKWVPLCCARFQGDGQSFIALCKGK